ncbi:MULTISPECIES: peptidase U32 family protein [unclassified Oleiphilus]|jgi:putative protease|uniref:ubiquinone anaerobic biosynthesis protein UbiU n=1 Tax=unclassified Oleiphilus TaxID=2631174 RepID=UPI0007C3B575|nr:MULTISPECIES: peptidase U32 family protein [unclassified Oleiphilus]KZY42082.1 protease [Oleiphilus sp. HI0050]KZY84745.1 protease [Oleiphilus sp. HI0068]KZY87623.1 protease [Oleiphilus sp. HI0069]KZZ20386.1 protease [Oleiphilus sp. HI0081]KZY32736.1 protease [Oleiphilus sp. HI0043]
MDLVCPAGSLPAFKKAVDSGASAVYVGFKDETNARHFSGLNFKEEKVSQALAYARSKGVKLYIAVNTYAQPEGWSKWQRAVDVAADIQADALICADMGVLDYATQKHPNLNLHLSVQGSGTNAESLSFYKRNFNVRRAVLPRVLSLKQVAQVAKKSPIELEVFAFGSLCIMAEGRCYLSSYLTDQSPNTCGACSPASFVRWEETEDGLESRLNNVLIDRYQEDEKAGYPTLCKGRFEVEGRLYNALEEPTSLNTIGLIPDLTEIGIKAVKIEGRQRSPAYVEQVVSVWRKALDSYQRDPDNFKVKPQWSKPLDKVSEGSQTTLGAYTRAWQ